MHSTHQSTSSNSVKGAQLYTPTKYRFFQKYISILLTLFLLTFSIIAQDDEPEITPEPLRQPIPLPIETVREGDYELNLYFEGIEQGNVGLIRLRGENIESARAILINQEIDYFYMPDDEAWFALLVVNMDVQARTHPVNVQITTTEGEVVSMQASVRIDQAGFIRQDFNVPQDRAYLIDPEVERHEFARLEAITATYTPERLWDNGGFDFPINAEITSPFGSYRVLNQAVQTRHTGWDQNAPVGTPVMAIADGRVAFAGRLDIRGNYVMIDHGFGIYSGYAHFSQVHVTRGQSIQQGQIIGLSGNTGRSSGPHLHWEIAVNSEWVDSIDFLQVWLP